MKNIALPILLLAAGTSFAQTIEKKLDHFDQVIVSPRINLVLVQGSEESVKINYDNVAESKINVKVKNHKLHFYLDHARFMEKRRKYRHDGETHKEGIYKNAVITAYVTYRDLQRLSVRGEQQVDVQGKIQNKKFKLTAYGECDLNFANVHVDKFKAVLYGQHALRVNEGFATFQKFKLFGENKIDTQSFQSEEVASSTYGESKLKFNASDNVRVVTFGESKVTVKGQADIDQFSLGEVSVRRQE